MAGKDKGKQGVVTQCMHMKNRVVVEGLNLVRAFVCALSGGFFLMRCW
jgi:ribosomal protein L24